MFHIDQHRSSLSLPPLPISLQLVPLLLLLPPLLQLLLLLVLLLLLSRLRALRSLLASLPSPPCSRLGSSRPKLALRLPGVVEAEAFASLKKPPVLSAALRNHASSTSRPRRLRPALEGLGRGQPRRSQSVLWLCSYVSCQLRGLLPSPQPPPPPPKSSTSSQGHSATRNHYRSHKQHRIHTREGQFDL